MQVWFKNRRAKLKREVKDGKSPQVSPGNSNGSKSGTPPYPIAVYSSDLHNSPTFPSLGLKPEAVRSHQPFLSTTYQYPSSITSELAAQMTSRVTMPSVHTYTNSPAPSEDGSVKKEHPSGSSEFSASPLPHTNGLIVDSNKNNSLVDVTDQWK